MKMFPSLFIFLVLSLTSCAQNLNSRIVLGEENAKKVVKTAVADKQYRPFYDTLIKTKETAIAIAEPILFSIYGRKDIIKERPYECYLIDGYWYISGTLPKGWLGGVFEIIINSKDGGVIKLIHGK
jgi:hypothetical protein